VVLKYMPYGLNV